MTAKIDCFAWGGYLFIFSVPAFQRIFKFFEALRARARETLDTVLATVPVENEEEFREACVGQMQMVAKLSQIARKPYLAEVTMAAIRRTIEEFHLDIEISRTGGRERLVFQSTPAKRWLILKLLDDDFLGSVMTNQRYEVNSKSAL